MLWGSGKILLAGALLMAGCRADPIYRYPHYVHDDDDDDDIDIDFDFDGDVDFEADASLDFDVDVDVDVDIASRIGDVFDRVTDVTSGTIVISRDPNVSRDPNRTYRPPTPSPTRTVRPARTPRPTTRPTRTSDTTTNPTRPTRPTTRPTRTSDTTTRPTRTTRPTARPTRTPRPTTRPTTRPTRTPSNSDSSGSGGNDNSNSNGSGGNDNSNSNGSGGNDNSNSNGSGGNDHVRVEVGELFSLTGTGTLTVEDAQGNAVVGVLLRLGSGALRELFLTRELFEHYLVVRDSTDVRRVFVTGQASRVTWRLEHEGMKVILGIEGGMLPDHQSANIALRLHLVTVGGVRMVSTVRTANLALREGRGSATFTLHGNDARLNFARGCYRWVVETSNRALFGDEFGGRCP